MIRPTRRAVLIFAVGIPVALIMVIADPALWPFSFDYGAFVLLAMATDALLAFPGRSLDVKIATPSRLFIGERGTIAAVIAATRHRRVTRFDLLCEQLGDAYPAEIVACELVPGREVQVPLPIIPRRRGKIRIERVWIRWRAPLALVTFSRRIEVGRAIDVLPNIRGVQSAALQFFAQEAVFGVKVQQQKGEGAEFDALRDYAPGLDSRVIDWKHSARHRKLLCKEFQAERNHQIVLSFDTGYLMSEPLDGIPRLDHAINAGLVLAWISLQGGDLVGTYAFDAAVRQYRQPIRGVSNFARLQQSTSEFAYRHDETNFTLGLAELNARLKRRALVILFTEFVDTVTAELLLESVQRIALRHVVVFVTLRDTLLQGMVNAPPDGFAAVAEAVVAHDLLRDRRIVFERLERMGIHCLDVASQALSVSLINRYLLIKQRGLI